MRTQGDREYLQIQSYQFRVVEAIINMVLRWLNRLLGRHENNLPPFDFSRNRFRKIKPWPPNVQALTHKQQFRFERKFKRRIKFKSLRPKFNKRVTVVQWTMISAVVIWAVLFEELDLSKWPQPGPDDDPLEQPFSSLRAWMWQKVDDIWTHSETSFKGERGQRRPEVLEESVNAANQRNGQSPRAGP